MPSEAESGEPPFVAAPGRFRAASIMARPFPIAPRRRTALSETSSPGRAPDIRKGRSPAFQMAAVALVIVSAIAGTGLARWLRGERDDKPGPERTPAKSVFPKGLF